MKNGESFFTFRLHSSDEPGEQEQTLVIFPGLHNLCPIDLAQHIEKTLEADLLPDHIVLIVAKSEFDQIEQAAREDADLNIAISRGKTVKSFTLVAFDKNGRVATTAPLRGSTPSGFCISTIRDHGLRTIVSENRSRIFVAAPPGFLFSKPSSRHSNYFIRAEGLLYGLAHTAFVAFCLLPNIGEWIDESGGSPEVIYVDSMSISPLAMALAEQFRRVGLSSGYPKIASFHSYEGLEQLPSPPKNGCICLISASTSCNLAVAWTKRFPGINSLAVTVLSMQRGSADIKVLHQLSRPKDYITKSESEDLQGYRLVRVSGENFWVEASPPRSVVLTKPRHCPKDLPQNMEAIVRAAAAGCHRISSPARPPHGLFIDDRRIAESDAFRAWLISKIEQHAPAHLTRIVFQNDAGSRSIAEYVKDYLESSSTIPAGRILLTTSEELARDTTQWRGAVIVVAAVIGKGSSLLSISRDLRDRQNGGARIYLTGVAITPSHAALDNLRKNLTHRKGGLRYEFHCFRAMPARDDGLRDSLAAEIALLQSLGADESEDDFLRGRWEQLHATGSGLDRDLFWPSASDCKTSLALRGEFAFWDFDYQHDGQLTPSPSDVLLTICTILQHSRESDDVPPDLRLSAPIFQHVVLSPECFYRFNDGIIQASLLRSCLRSELDYRAEIALSNEMAALLRRIVENWKTERGEAAYEFLLAVASRRLQLAQGSLDDVLGALMQEACFTRLPEKIRTLLMHIRSNSATDAT